MLPKNAESSAEDPESGVSSARPEPEPSQAVAKEESKFPNASPNITRPRPPPINIDDVNASNPLADPALCESTYSNATREPVLATIVTIPEDAADFSKEIHIRDDDVKVSQIVRIYVAHPILIASIQLVVVLLATVFALPFVSLSNPAAGLRLRDDPIGDRADGFLAAANLMQPSGFTDGILGLNNVKPTQVPVRTQDADGINIIWFTLPSDNIFSQANLEKMKQFEDQIFNLPTYQKLLCILQPDGSCAPIRSAASVLLGNQSAPLSARIDDLYKSSPNYFQAGYLPHKNQVNTYTQTKIRLGAPLTGFTSPDDRSDQQSTLRLKWVKQELIPLLLTKAWDSGTQPRLTFNYDEIVTEEGLDALAHDVTLAAVAMTLIFLCLLEHFRSLFLAITALLQVVAPFPLAMFFYRNILGIRLFGGMHVLGMFLVLGIGVDDCFLFFDHFDQISRERPNASLRVRFQLTLTEAKRAIFATTFTTSLSFMVELTSGMPILVYFGVFCSLLVLTNFILIMTIFSATLIIWDIYFKARPADTMGSPGLGRFRSTVIPTTTRTRVASVMTTPLHKISRSFSFVSESLPEVSASIPSIVPLSTGAASRLQKLNAKFLEIMFVRIGERFVTHRIGRVLIIVIAFSLMIILATFASQLQPSTGLDSFWAPGNPFRYYEEYSSKGFVGDTFSKASFQFMNGLKAPFRVGYDYTNDYDFGTPVYDPAFDITDPAVQMYLIHQCDTVRSSLSSNIQLYSRNISLCPMTEFRDWLLSKGLQFPVRNATEFHFRILEFVYQPYQTAVMGLGFRTTSIHDFTIPPYTVNFQFNSFPTTRSQTGDGLEERESVYGAWSAFAANGTVPFHLGADGSDAPVDGFYDSWMETQLTLLDNSYQSISLSMGVALAVLFLASRGDVYSSIVGVICLSGSVACTLGVMYLAGWTLGAVESVACSILCGIAIDFGIHMAVTYSETFAALGRRARRERVLETLRKVGVPVLFGGLTMFTSSCVMLLCELGILVKFGQFMIVVIIFSLVLAILVQMALLSLPIPSKPLWLHTEVDEKPFPNVIPARVSRTLSTIDAPSAMSRLSSLGEKLPKSPTRFWSDRLCFGSYVLFISGLAVAVLGIGLSQTTFATVKPPPSYGPSTPILPTVDILSNKSFAQLKPNGWTEVSLPLTAHTGCGSPTNRYSFFVYRNMAADAPDSVQIEFEGRASGVCFSKDTCSSGAFKTAVDRSRFERINWNSERFPFFDNTPPRLYVYFPYCTADAFLGNTTVNYDGQFLIVKHVGANNVRMGMDWLMKSLATSTTKIVSPSTTVVFQGCGIGGVGALATSIWASPLFQIQLGLTRTSLIVDSFTKTLNQGIIELVAYVAWGSRYSLSIPAAYQVNNGRMLLASSAYDWFQTLLGQFPQADANQFRTRVEENPEVFPFLLQLNGDRHCVVLNPVQDRQTTDFRVTKAVRYFIGTSNTAPLTTELFYKCSVATMLGGPADDCQFDADLRNKTALCNNLPFSRFCPAAMF